jgi:S1-C subfamily serine protease
MTRLQAVALLVGGILAASGTPAGAADNVVPTVLKSTVIIDAGSGTGAGFVVAANRVLTAAHVVSGSSNVVVRLGAVSKPGHVIKADRGRDLALIAVVLDAPALSLVPDEPVPGSTVFAVGNPLGAGLSVSRGIVSGVRDVDGQRDVQTDAAINPGNSGGPLVNEQGGVVGVVVSKLRDASGIALAVSAGTARAFLSGSPSSADSSRDPGRPASRAHPTEAVSDLALLSGGVGLLLLGGIALAAMSRKHRVRAAPEIEVVLHPTSQASSRTESTV